jgi:hypothetical protein
VELDDFFYILSISACQAGALAVIVHEVPRIWYRWLAIVGFLLNGMLTSVCYQLIGLRETTHHELLASLSFHLLLLGTAVVLARYLRVQVSARWTYKIVLYIMFFLAHFTGWGQIMGNKIFP